MKWTDKGQSEIVEPFVDPDIMGYDIGRPVSTPSKPMAEQIETNNHLVRVYLLGARWASLVGYCALPPQTWDDWLHLYGDKDHTCDPLWLNAKNIVSVQAIRDGYTMEAASKAA